MGVSSMADIRLRITVSLALAAILPIAASFADDINWYTIDGGGATFSTGGPYSLGGTIGQHDAGPTTGPMTGGMFSLTGGFWAVGLVCTCSGDLNGDGQKNGGDVQAFVNCATLGVGNCACADIDGNSVLNAADVAAFAASLIGGSACP